MLYEAPVDHTQAYEMSVSMVCVDRQTDGQTVINPQAVAAPRYASQSWSMWLSDFRFFWLYCSEHR